MSDWPYVYNPSRNDTALGRLYSQFRNKPNFQALIRGLSEGGLQVMEDLGWEVLTGTAFGLATGKSLDQWGEIVGQQRLDFSDAEYRGFIAARVIHNIGQGHPDEMILMAQHTMDPIKVWYRDLFPAAFTIYALRPSLMRETRRAEVRRMFQSGSPAGVYARIVEAPVGFDGVADPSGLAPSPFADFGPSGVGLGRIAREV